METASQLAERLRQLADKGEFDGRLFSGEYNLLNNAADRLSALSEPSGDGDAQWLREFADTAVRSGPEHFRKQLHAIADRITLSEQSEDGERSAEWWLRNNIAPAVRMQMGDDYADELLKYADRLSDCDRLRERVKELEGEQADHDAGFDLRWTADMRAIKRWQGATGRDLTWPDHADLCVWLLEQIDKLQPGWSGSDVK